MADTEIDSLSFLGIDTGLSSPTVDKIAAALAKAQSEIKTVTKNKTGKVAGTSKKSGVYYEYSYKYADFEAVREAVRDVAAKQGLAIVMRPDGDTLHALLLHNSGQWIDYGKYPLGAFESHQTRGGAITYAKRYIESCVYDIATDEDDDATHVDAQAKPSLQKPIPHPHATATPAPPGEKSAFTTPEQRTAWFGGVNRAVQAALSLTDLDEVKNLYKTRLKQIKDNSNPEDMNSFDKLMKDFDARWEALIPRAKESVQSLSVDEIMRNAAVPLDAPTPPQAKGKLSNKIPHNVIDDEIPY